MTEFFASIDWAVIGVKLIALAALLLFAKQPVKQLVFSRPSAEIREQVEQSLFLLASFSLFWHFSGSYMSHVFSQMTLNREEKIQLYYFVYSFHDVLGLAILTGLHWLKKCSFSKICRWVYYLTTCMVVLQMMRYIDRVYLETEYLNLVYMPLKTTINLATLALISSYPVLRIFNLKPSHQWG
ncbi:hypothetical protein [Pseudoalteromonas sp. MMG012]|uniref:hypothetical protein n=1 Tax=Pseudoalteromonas sp. MMG012 TaxID=2822686 RepID=UPI001B3A3B63|nr:hypothetical protein [Pseudoalteromonas sp. MMG012]MBQ4852953.1 hypothetical protein [Pseudoalteromonas sp. MMG012]